MFSKKPENRNHHFKKSNLTDEQNSFYVARKRMVEEKIMPEVKHARVIEAMSRVPRDRFVPDGLKDQAYLDRPLNIGEGQTISQPLIVATMTSIIDPKPTDKILELGTGSGYQAAILCELSKHVYSIERISGLSNRARRALYDIGYMNFTLRIGDGTNGWPEKAPFNGIIVTAGSPDIPKPLYKQLADGGKLVIPVGGAEQQALKVITRKGRKFIEETVFGCRFVKLIGEHGWNG